ncbi:MAG: hypothetical protein IKM80_03745 [Bacilli bacterium]|nr:hypothetical protein [Bacilli bacterium]
MKRTTDEMIYILSEYARTHKDEIRDFDDLTPYIAEHPEIFGKKGEEDSESYKAYYEGENTLNEEEAKAHFKKAIELDPLNFDARSELLALESKDSNHYAAKGLDIQTKGLELFTKNEEYKSYIGKFFETTTTASFLRFSKSLMEQFYMAGEYQIAVSLGKEMLMLDLEDHYKARYILFKALVGLGDDIAIREFIRDYRFKKDAYFYATLGLYKLSKGYSIEAFNILSDDCRMHNAFISDCILYANDYEIKNESEKPVENFMDEIPYEGGPREALNYTDDPLPFDASILEEFQNKNLSEYLKLLSLSFEESATIVSLCEIALTSNVEKLPLETIKSIFKGESKEYESLPVYGEIKKEEKILEIIKSLTEKGLLVRKGPSIIIKHDAYTAFMAICRLQEKGEVASAQA